MKQTAFRLVCTALLLCTVLLALPACAADFDETYLPITDVALSDIKEGTAWSDFVNDHAGEAFVYIPNHAFFRVKDGQSVMVIAEHTAQGNTIQKIFAYERTTLASKSEFMALTNGISIQEVIEKVGLPVSDNPYLSSAHVLYFPVSNGQICSMRISTADYTLQSFEFLDSLSSMPG